MVHHFALCLTQLAQNDTLFLFTLNIIKPQLIIAHNQNLLGLHMYNKIYENTSMVS
jgi:hypothetical protein